MTATRPATTLRRAVRAAGVALLASLGTLALTAAPAAAAPCAVADLSLQAVLAPGGSEVRTVTVDVAPGSTLVVGEPVASGALAPDLTSTLHWCAGTECTTATGAALAPGTSVAVPDGAITFVFTVALDSASTLQDSAGSVRQQVQLSSESCSGVSAPPTTPPSPPSEPSPTPTSSGTAAGTATGTATAEATGDTSRPSGQLGATGQSLTPALWGVSAIAVGALLWALARRRRQEQR